MIPRWLASNRATASASGLFAFVVYLRTVAPTIYGLDSSELTTAAYTLGPAHPPGYPLYLILGRLFISLFPVGDPGYRLNVMSALFGALAVALLCLILLRLGSHRLVAATAALSLAFSFYFWSPALMAEVYTLHALLAALMVLLLLEIQERPGSRALPALALTFGASVSNHLTTLLLAPGLAYVVWRSGGLRAPARRLALNLGCLALGLSLYLYLPLSGAARTVAEFAEVATARSFWPFLFSHASASFGRELLLHIQGIWINFLGIGFALALVGIAAGWKRRRNLTTGLLLMAATSALFFAAYGVVDKSLMQTHVYLIWALWMGVGLQWLVEWVQASKPELARAALVPLLLLPAAVFGINYAHADLSDAWEVRRMAEQWLATIEPDAYLVVRSWVERTPVEYLQEVEGQRPDVNVLEIHSLAGRAGFDQLLANVSGRRPLYTTAIFFDDDGDGSRKYQWIESCQCFLLEKR